MYVYKNQTLKLFFFSIFFLGLSYGECRPGDSLFIQTQVSLEVIDSLGESQMDRTVDSSSESNCFSKCRNIFTCKSATFFADSDNGPKCLLKDKNRFGVRNRIKLISIGKYFEKTESCSRLSRERRRVIGAVKNALDCKDVLKKGWKKDGIYLCLLYTSPSPRDATLSRMPSSA